MSHPIRTRRVLHDYAQQSQRPRVVIVDVAGIFITCLGLFVLCALLGFLAANFFKTPEPDFQADTPQIDQPHAAVSRRQTT